jgi:C4-dicarboxylate transporter DctM subunit
MDSAVVAGLICIVALLGILLMGVHIGFAAVVIGFVMIIWFVGLGPALGVVTEVTFSMCSMYALSVCPLFILMGYLIFHAGFGRDLFATAQKWLGRLPGGLAVATTGACAFFGASSGSSLAAVALFGRVAAPEMEALGYDQGLTYGCVAASSTLAALIPPSIPMIVYAVLAGVSVGKLFIAGIIPGILSASIFAIMITIRVWRNPRLAPLPSLQVSWRMRFSSLKGVWGITALIVLVLGGIYMGIFTPTEAAGVGAVGALLIGLASRRYKKVDLWRVLVESASATSMIFVIVIGISLFTRLMALSGFSREFATFIIGLPVPPLVILIGFFGLFIILGMFMDAIGMLVLTIPILCPIVQVLGYDLIWFGILVVKLCEVALITPPVGLNCYVLKGVAPHVPLQNIFRGTGWFLAMEFLTLAILVALPQLSLFLPNLMK